jgi:hypothetical protein
MDNINDYYISLYNENQILNPDNDTLKINNNYLIYINKVYLNLIEKSLNNYLLLGSNNNNDVIYSKLTNDYIVDETIDKIKIYNLTNELLAITNNFNNFYDKTYINALVAAIGNNFSLYYTKIESDNLYYNKTYINSLISNYYLKT